MLLQRPLLSDFYVHPPSLSSLFLPSTNLIKHLLLSLTSHLSPRYDGAEGHSDRHAPTLAVALGLGLVQLSRGTDDLDPIILDTKLEPLTQCKWDTMGSVLAVAGLRKEGRDGRDVTVVQVNLGTVVQVWVICYIRTGGGRRHNY